MADAISIINSLKYNAYYLRTLEDLRFDFDTICAGNSAVAVRCYKHNSNLPLSLKCYYHSRGNVATIYGDNYKPKELGVMSFSGNPEFIDVILSPWVEGEPLDQAVVSPNANYRQLSRKFDAMALHLLNCNYAHGDIKPDNIVVCPTHELALIDWDASWRPGFTDEDMEECGTTTFSHPERINLPFDKHIDDFSIAVLSTMLAALAIDSKFFLPRLSVECSLFEPKDAINGCDQMLNHAIDLFGRTHDAAHFRIASAIVGCRGPIPHLKEWLMEALKPTKWRMATGAISRYGLCWGIKRKNVWVIPPLYDYIEANGNSTNLYLGNHCHTVSGRVSMPMSYRQAVLSQVTSSNAWTLLEEERMLMWYCENISVNAIAKALSRSPQAVRARLNRIIPKFDRKRIEYLRERIRFK